MRSEKSKTAWCGGTAAAEKDNKECVPLFSFPSSESVKGWRSVHLDGGAV